MTVLKLVFCFRYGSMLSHGIGMQWGGCSDIKTRLDARSWKILFWKMNPETIGRRWNGLKLASKTVLTQSMGLLMTRTLLKRWSSKFRSVLSSPNPNCELQLVNTLECCVLSGLDFKAAGGCFVCYCLSNYLLWRHRVTVNITWIIYVETLERAPTPFFDGLVRCSAHGCSFVRLWYSKYVVLTGIGKLKQGKSEEGSLSSDHLILLQLLLAEFLLLFSRVCYVTVTCLLCLQMQVVQSFLKGWEQDLEDFRNNLLSSK